MRICLFTRAVLGHGIGGGMERHAHTLATGLAERGHEVVVLTTARPDGTSDAEEGPLVTHHLPAPAARYSPAWWQASVATFARLDAARPFDLVWSQSAGALGYLAMPGRRVPCVAIMHGSMQGELRTRLQARPWPRALALLAAYLPQAASFACRWRRYGPRLAAALAPSRETAAENLRELGIAPQRLAVVPLGVDLDRFAPSLAAGAALRRRLGIAPQAAVLLVAGRLAREKGGHIALAALERLAHRGEALHLLVAGAGRDAVWLQRLAARAGLAAQVHFLGAVPHADLPACYNAADLCLLPSLSWEAFPLALLEALACGRPVVASRVGSIPGLIDGREVGALVPAGDEAALATAVGELLQAPTHLESMGRAARQLAEAEFALEAMCRRTEGVFRDCLPKRGAP